MNCKHSLLDIFETLVISLSTSKLGGMLVMEMVKESLLSEEAKQKQKVESSSEALISEIHKQCGRSEYKRPKCYGN